MKHSSLFSASHRSTAALLLALLAAPPTFANSIIAGGHVPAIQNVTITPFYGESPPSPDGAVEVATLEIDNNLPEYGLVLDFTGRKGNHPAISQVRLEALGGTLGTGLDAPGYTILPTGSIAGQFIWSPGSQQTATLGYRVRVMVTYAFPPADPPLMRVAMPASY